jgi:hypothetical protein
LQQQSQRLNPQELHLKLHVMAQRQKKQRKLRMMLSKQPLQLQEQEFLESQLNEFVLKEG